MFLISSDSDKNNFKGQKYNVHEILKMIACDVLRYLTNHPNYIEWLEIPLVCPEIVSKQGGNFLQSRENLSKKLRHAGKAQTRAYSATETSYRIEILRLGSLAKVLSRER